MEAELLKPSTASVPSSSSGRAATGLTSPGAKTDAASPGRERLDAGHVVVEAETSRWPRGQNIMVYTIESCAWESVA
jgi:hypothetical protein